MSDHRISDAELAKRLAFVREFGPRTFGAEELTAKVLGDKVDYAKSSKREISEAEDTKHSKALRAAASFKARNDGVIGVAAVRERGVTVYRAKAQKGNVVRQHQTSCLVAAVRYRNENIEKLFPGADVLKCELEAAVRKFGACVCRRCAGKG